MESRRTNDNLSPFCLKVIFPKDAGEPFENLSKQERKLLNLAHDSIESPYQTEAHFRSIDEADIIITIGGGLTTYLSGSYAMVSRKKIVPIGSFGGASKKILDKVLKSMHRDIYRREDLESLKRDWSAQVLSAVRTLVAEFPLIFIIHGQAKNDLKDLEEFLKRELGTDHNHIVMEKEFAPGKTPTEKF
jgi:hypothetical protein